MNSPPTRNDAAPTAPRLPRPRTGLVTLVFTDVVGSTALKQRLGDRAGSDLLHRHHQLVREVLARFPDASEIGVAGDSFFLVLTKPSESVRFALELQAGLRRFNQGAPPEQVIEDRIGIHLGEVLIEGGERGQRVADFQGIHVDLCSRVMSLARGGQVLCTRPVFDNARQVLRGEALEGIGPLSWLSHGLYQLKGVDEPVEVCEVTECVRAQPTPPTSTDKARRVADAQGAPLPGWRPAIGQVVPNTHWQLERQLGVGGFGEVWLGRHQTLKELRVFKFCFQADRARALKREMTLFRLLRERIGEHPHIVSLREVFFDEPPYYLETEYIEGSDFRTWCEQSGPVKGSLEGRLEILAQIAEALQAAHDAGVIHRDLKPANILVSIPKGEGGGGSRPTAKLADFGIGQVLSQECLAGVTQTGFTQTILADASTSGSGTFLYMAPELLAGRPASIRTDLYSLGVVLFQTVLGDFDRPLTSDWKAEVADSLLREDIQHCVAGRPEDRFAGAAELARRLRALPQRRVERERTLAAQAERERLRRQAHTRHRLLLAAGASLLVLLAIVAALAIGLRRAERAELGAVAERDRQRRLAYAADMNLAQQALATDNLGRARQLLARHRPRPGADDFQGWEWRYLWQQCQSDELATLCVRSNSIDVLAVSADGRWLAVGEFLSRGLGLWDLPGRKEVARLAPETSLFTVAFSPTEGRLAFAGIAGYGSAEATPRLVIWDLEAGRALAEVDLPGLCVGMGFSADGGTLVTASAGGADTETVARWEVPTGRRLGAQRVAQGSQRPGAQFGVSRDLQRAVGASRDLQTLRVLDLDSGAERWTAQASPGNVFQEVVLSPDGHSLAAGQAYAEPGIRLWEAASGRELGVLEGHRAWVASLVFWPDGKTLASGSADQTIRLWDIASRRCIATLRGHELEVWRLCLLPDQQTLVSGGKDGSIKLWNTAQACREQRPYLQVTNVSSDWFFTFDSRAIITRDGDGAIVRRGGAGFMESRRVSEPGAFGKATLLPSPDGRFVAAGGEDGRVRVWDLANERLAHVFTASTGLVAAVAFLDANTRLAVYQSPEQSLQEWELGSGRPVRTWPGTIRIPHGFDPSGNLRTSRTGDRLLFFGGTDVGGGLANRQTGMAGARRLEFVRPADLAFAPDGNSFAVASEQGFGQLWDIASLRETATFRGFLLGVHSVAFSPDGRRLAFGSNGREAVKVWDLASQQELLTLEGEGSIFGRTRFSPDGNLLGSVNANATLHLWRAPSWEELASGPAGEPPINANGRE